MKGFFQTFLNQQFLPQSWCWETKYFAFGKMNDQTYSPYDYKGQVVKKEITIWIEPGMNSVAIEFQIPANKHNLVKRG